MYIQQIIFLHSNYFKFQFLNIRMFNEIQKSFLRLPIVQFIDFKTCDQT